MLLLQNLTKNYSFNVFEKFCVTLPETGMIGVVGESGCGKSTLLRCIAMQTEVEGDIIYNGQTINHGNRLKQEKCRTAIFSTIDQEPQVLFGMTAREYLGYFSTASEEIVGALERVGLSNLADENTSVLSGGELQRLAVARVILQNTPIVLADEPTASLDEASAVAIMDLLYDLSRYKLVILATHDRGLLSKYTHSNIVFVDETITHNISCDEVCANQSLESSHAITKLSFKRKMAYFAKSMGKNKAKTVVLAVSLLISFISTIMFFAFYLPSDEAIVKINYKQNQKCIVPLDDDTQTNSFLLYQKQYSLHPNCLLFVNFGTDVDFQMAAGSLPQAYNEVVISDIYAIKSFGSVDNAIGQSVKTFYGTGGEDMCKHKVTGVYISRSISAEKDDKFFFADRSYIDRYMEWYSYANNLVGNVSYMKKVENISADDLICGKYERGKRNIVISKDTLAKIVGEEYDTVSQNVAGFFAKMPKKIKIGTTEFLISGVGEYNMTTDSLIPFLFINACTIDQLQDVDNVYDYGGDKSYMNSILDYRKPFKYSFGIIAIISLCLAVIIGINYAYMDISENKKYFSTLYRNGYNRYDLYCTRLEGLMIATIVILAVAMLIAALALFAFSNIHLDKLKEIGYTLHIQSFVDYLLGLVASVVVIGAIYLVTRKAMKRAVCEGL